MKKDYLLKSTAILVGASTSVFSMESNFDREFNQRRAEMNHNFQQSTAATQQRLPQAEAERQKRLAEAQQRADQREVENQQSFQRNQHHSFMGGFPGSNSHSNQAAPSFGNFNTLFDQFQNEMGKQNVFKIDPSFRASMNNMENFLSNSGSNKSIDSIPSTNNNSSYKSPSLNSSIINSYSSPSNQKINNFSILDNESRKVTTIPTQNKIEPKNIEPKKEIMVVEQSSEDRELAEAIRESLLISQKLIKETKSVDKELAEGMRQSLLISEKPIKETKSVDKDFAEAKRQSLLMSAQISKEDDYEDRVLAEAIRQSLLMSAQISKEDDYEDRVLAEAIRQSLLESAQPVQKANEEKSQVISTVDIAEIIKGLPVDTTQNDFLKVIMATGKYKSEEKVIETLKDMLMWFDD